MEKNGEVWEPLWFKEEIDEITKYKIYVYKGNYWNLKENNKGF